MLNPFALFAWLVRSLSFKLSLFHSSRGSKNCTLSELAERKLVELKVSPSSLERVDFLFVLLVP